MMFISLYCLFFPSFIATQWQGMHLVHSDVCFVPCGACCLGYTVNPSFVGMTCLLSPPPELYSNDHAFFVEVFYCSLETWPNPFTCCPLKLNTGITLTFPYYILSNLSLVCWVCITLINCFLLVRESVTLFDYSHEFCLVENRQY